MFGKNPHAEPPAVGVGRKRLALNVAPADDVAIRQSDEHRVLLRHETENEVARLRRRHRLQERKIPSLAGDNVHRKPIAFNEPG